MYSARYLSDVRKESKISDRKACRTTLERPVDTCVVVVNCNAVPLRP